MNITLIRFFILFAIVFSLSACDNFSTVVDIESPEFDQRITLSGLLTPGLDRIQFLVGKNQGIFTVSENDQYLVYDAEIFIFNEGGNSIEFSQDLLGGFYAVDSTEDFFISGETYQIDVNHPELSTVTAEVSIPNRLDNLRNIEFKENGGVDLDGYRISAISFDIVDPEGEDNYYEIKLEYRREAGDEFRPIYITSIDPVYEEDNYTNGGYVRDRTFDGDTKFFQVQFDNYYSTIEEVEFRILWRSLNKESYEFNKALSIFRSNGDNPFASPIQIPSNIEGGLGFIESYSEEVYDIIR